MQKELRFINTEVAYQKNMEAIKNMIASFYLDKEKEEERKREIIKKHQEEQERLIKFKEEQERKIKEIEETKKKLEERKKLLLQEARNLMI